MISPLVMNGIVANEKDVNGQTALHIASKEGKLVCIKPLITNFLNVNEKDNEKRTPLHLAGYFKNTSFLNYIEKTSKHLCKTIFVYVYTCILFVS